MEPCLVAGLHVCDPPPTCAACRCGEAVRHSLQRTIRDKKRDESRGHFGPRILNGSPTPWTCLSVPYTCVNRDIDRATLRIRRVGSVLKAVDLVWRHQLMRRSNAIAMRSAPPFHLVAQRALPASGPGQVSRAERRGSPMEGVSRGSQVHVASQGESGWEDSRAPRSSSRATRSSL